MSDRDDDPTRAQVEGRLVQRDEEAEADGDRRRAERRATSETASRRWRVARLEPVAVNSSRSATTATSCTRASTLAVGRSRRSSVARLIATSSVAYRCPPRTSTTPNDVKVNKKTMAVADAIAGRSNGHVTSR